MNLISDAADPNVETIFGQYTDENMRDEMTITVIASTFNDDPTLSADGIIGAESFFNDSGITKVPSTTLKKDTASTPASEDYSAFFDMINRH